MQPGQMYGFAPPGTQIPATQQSMFPMAFQSSTFPMPAPTANLMGTTHANSMGTTRNQSRSLQMDAHTRSLGEGTKLMPPEAWMKAMLGVQLSAAAYGQSSVVCEGKTVL